jgi:xanthine dehydrogenase/oxidase
MAMYGLWMNNKEPTVHDIEENFDGNLCRCTGYRPILHAFQPFASDYETLKVSGSVHPSDGPLQKRQCVATAQRCNGHIVPSSVKEDSIRWGEQLNDRFDEVFKQLPVPRGSVVQGSHLGHDCEWCRPTTLHDAVVLAGTRSNVRLQVGNTERRIEKFFKGNHKYPLSLISLSQVGDLLGIAWSETQVRIGASTPLGEIHANFLAKMKAWDNGPRTRVLQSYCAMFKWFAGHQIRNVACLGGNIATASPISDLNPCHVAAGVELEVAYLRDDGGVGIRKIAMNNTDAPFFSGYRKTALGPRELIVAIVLPVTKPDGSEFFQAFKQARRRDDDLAIVNAAMRVRFDGAVVADASFAFGGMAPFTKACDRLSRWWRGQEWTHSNFMRSLDELVEDIPLPDGAPGGMCEYRRALARSFYFKFWTSVAYARRESKPPAPLGARDIGAALVHSTSPSFNRPPARGLQHYGRDQKSLLQQTGDPDKHRAGDMHVSGHAKYLDDIPAAPNEIFLDFVMSTKAHARVTRLDASRARQVPGFVDIVTAEDVVGDNITGPIAHDEEVFATKEVHYFGQIIAAVCATSRYAARVAAKAVIVEYEVLPAIVGIEDAVKQGSLFNLMFQDEGDQEAEVHTVETARGESVDAILETAGKDDNFVVVEGEIFMGPQEQFYFETNATRVEPRENGEFHIVSSSQNPAETQLLVAKALGAPLSKVTSTVKRIGGGFGGKESRACVLSVTAAVAAQKLMRPVRFQLDRDVDQTVSGMRHGFLGRYRLAVDKANLKLVAADTIVYANGGWSLDLSQPVLNRAMLHVTNACRIPSVRSRGRICKTNLPSNTAFRGFGGPQGMFVAETMFEHAARVLRVSREELLQRNLYEPGDLSICQQPLGKNVPLRQMWDQLMEQSEFSERRSAVEEFNRNNRYLKRGLAAVPTAYGISFTATHLNQSGALVHMQKDGSVLVAHGGVEMGQGLHTKLARVAASVLDLPIEAIYIKETSTDTVSNTVATAASSGTDLNGGAVLNACEQLRERLAPFREKYQPKQGQNGAPSSGEQRQEAMAKAAMDAWFARVNLTAQGYHRSPIKGINWKQKGVNEMHGDPFWYYTYGVACSEVEVDCLTGDMTVLRGDLIHDVGRTLNAAVDIGQVEGAFMQGVGLYTVEEIVFTKDGNLASKGPGMYKLPGFGDVPIDFRVRLLENSEGPAVLGSKAVGEPPLFLGSSVYFAAKEAILAARRDCAKEVAEKNNSSPEAVAVATAAAEHVRIDAPATAERIRMACLDFLNPSGHITPWHARA